MAGKTKSRRQALRPATQLVHGGTLRSQFGETSEAIFMTQATSTTAPSRPSARFKGDEPGFIYSRYANPTVAMFEERMRLIEGAEAARATASGMAAVTSVFLSWLKAGDHVVAAKALFGSCRYVVEDLLPRYGIKSTLVDGNDLKQWKQAARQEHQGVLPGEPDQPDARGDRHRRGGRDRPQGGRQAGGRQRLRHAALPEAAGARRRRRRLFGDQAHRRPGPLPRRGDPRRPAVRHRPPAHLPAPDRPVDEPVQRLGAAQGAGDAAAARRAADGERRRARRPARRPPEDRPRALSRPRRPSAGRDRQAADDRRLDHDRLRGQGRAQGAPSRWRTRSPSSASPTISATPRA